MQCIRGRCGWLSDEDELGRLFFLSCPFAVRLSLCFSLAVHTHLAAGYCSRCGIPQPFCPPPSSVSIRSTPSHATLRR